jgi:prepilin-type N-terminal cleavage/methylation domain-containing protein
MKKHGFTLIELLIVVAIIAILAAIAVPNFLEAQTRSKVARVKNDLRTMNTAFMAYFTDNMKVPPDGNDPNTPASMAGWNWNLENPGQIPDYAFNGSEGFCAFRYFVPLTTPVAFITSIPGDAFTRRMPYQYDTRFEEDLSRVAYCIVSSSGPDRIAGDWLRFNTPNFMALAYDATNGTKSRGDIWRGMVVLNQVLFNQEYPFDVR